MEKNENFSSENEIKAEAESSVYGKSECGNEKRNASEAKPTYTKDGEATADVPVKQNEIHITAYGVTDYNSDTSRKPDTSRKLPRFVRLKNAVIIAVLAALVSAAAGGLAVLMITDFAGYNELGLSKEGWNKLRWGLNAVKENYYQDIKEDKLVDAVLSGVAASLDDYTAYMSKDDSDSFMQSVNADNYAGVGLYITASADDNSVIVITPLKNSPAEKKGIKTGDKIKAVNGTAVFGRDIEEASNLMLGKPGTSVTVTVLKADSGKLEDIEIVREKIKLETVYSDMETDDIGYIQISQFGVNTAEEFEEHFNELCDEGARKLIIDLRGNPGGYVDAAVSIADVFVDKGKVIVSTKNKKGEEVQYIAQTAGRDIPIVILGNEGTASASEVLIGALRDLKGAKLIGEKTYGKGVTQIVVPYKDGSSLKVTDSRHYTPSGKCIDKQGFEPDIKITNSDTEDLQLKAAIEALS